MLVIDAAFVAALWRVGRGAGVRLWLVLVPLLGPLDVHPLRPGVRGAGRRSRCWRSPPARPGRRGAAAAGAAVKLWPAGLLPAPAGPPGAAAAGAGRLRRVRRCWPWSATLAAGGTGRLLSPLTWQSDRGLQLETIWAVPLLFARCFDSATWSTPYTRFFAFQVEGPGAGTALHLSTIATVAACCCCSTSAGGPGGPGRPGWPWSALLSVAAACLLIVPNKTLSPQYLLWIGGVLAAPAATAPDERTLPRLNAAAAGHLRADPGPLPDRVRHADRAALVQRDRRDAAGRPQRAARRDHRDRGPAGAAADPRAPA